MANDGSARRLVPVRLSAFGALPTQALMTVAELSPATRLGRGVKALAVGWGAAVAAVFLPILHLVLVPSFAVGGVIAAIVFGKQSRRVTRLRGQCPRCLTEEDFEASGKVRRSRIVTCPHCHTNVTLLAGDATSAKAPVAAGAQG